MKLRSKILLALISVGVIPLVVALWVVGGMVASELELQVQMRNQDSANFIEQATTKTSSGDLALVTLLSSNPFLVNAVYSAGLSGDVSQLTSFLSNLEKLSFDQIQVLGKDGQQILRVFMNGNQEIPPTSGTEHPVIEASLEGEAYAESGLFDGRMAITSAAPISMYGEPIGHLVAVTYFDKKLATRLKTLSRMEIAFFDESGIFAATAPELDSVDLQSVLTSGSYVREVNGKKSLITYNSIAGKDRGVLIALDISTLDNAKSSLLNATIITALIMIGVSVLVGLLVSTGIVRPLREVVVTLREISAGSGDLTRELDVRTSDEVGELSECFNAFLARQREMVGRIRAVTNDLGKANEQIRGASHEVMEGAVHQSQALEESSKGIEGIDDAAVGIAESTGNLVTSVEESSSATLELGATIEEIASQMEKLFSTVDEVSSSINEMSVSSQEVSENVGILSSSTEVTVSSMLEMDASIKEIEHNAAQTSKLASEAAEDAQRGMQTVDETIKGIESIQKTVDRASGAIEELGEKSSAIGKILTVIDEVADQTSLLALNAAIIAAQAGEHGKGFAVVADEIRELAERTAISTREIGTIISNLQEGTQEAVLAMKDGSEQVYKEVKRSKDSSVALEKIRSSTLKAMEQVNSIVRATEEQSRGSRQVTDSMNQVAAMLEQIATAVNQQNSGIRLLAESAELMRDIAAHGKQSTSEQSKGSKQINASMEQIRTMITIIDDATRALTQRSRDVVGAVGSVHKVAESNASRTAELDHVVETLNRLTIALEEEVGVFKT
ncbi:MAG: HAMP domain-containing protein [Deltaproteobacteria bacterium]|jgi:methyl-accepting chemotaxis protein|nr:HAMP domain-containing protein [Deltaproteobacteria bacterium]MDH4007342.1 methyl-accepting chemotaxis protein [Desulfuromonadales bacterium]